MKYFVISDIHSFATPMIGALKMAGFRKTNKDHTLIVCGDIFDRGEETLEVYKYLRSIPKKRLILIKGNHESLYFALLKKSFPDSYDFSNGTVKTFCSIAGINEDKLTAQYWYKKTSGDGWYDRVRAVWDNIKEHVKNSDITKWLATDNWLNYYEVDNFIFVHSFIPVKNKDGLPGYYTHHRALTPFNNWRIEATEQDWEDARWGCPWKQYKDGLFDFEKKNDKILVCGHWHTYDFWENLDHIYGSGDEIYYSKNLVGIDGGVHIEYGEGFKPILTHDQNVFVITPDGYYDKYGCEIDLKDRTE